MVRTLCPVRTALLASALVLLIVPVFSQVEAAEPLHRQIDRLIAERANGPLAPRASDEEFLRRVYLDFTGRIPSVEEARQFLDDQSPDKRQRLIDRLLSSPEYPRRMEELFHVMLMERRGDHPEWRRFLRKAFEQNEPWDQMAREILFPSADDSVKRGAAFFYTKRLEKYGQNPTDYPGLTRDIGRLFLGMDLQCAQCHDHVHVEDYKQSWFQGLFAFVSPTFIRRDVSFPAVGVKPLAKKLDFQSVFLKEPRQTGPRLPGDEEIQIVSFKRGEEYAKPPDRKTRFPGEPKFNTLKLLGERLPRRENEAFVRNIVNRLWFVMMGRGLVHPLDLHHSGNPPSHPELLGLLSREFAAHRFDIKYLLRELALSQTYQRSGLIPAGWKEVPPLQSYRIFNERPLSAEQLLHSMLQAVGPATAPRSKTEIAAVEKRFTALQSDFVTAFGNTPKEPEVDFSPSVKSALFVMNSRKVLDLLQPAKGNLIDRLTRMNSAEKAAEELYLAVLSRRPTAEEVRTVEEHLKTHGKNNSKAVGHLVWALLSCTEFCVNH